MTVVPPPRKVLEMWIAQAIEMLAVLERCFGRAHLEANLPSYSLDPESGVTIRFGELRACYVDATLCVFDFRGPNIRIAEVLGDRLGEWTFVGSESQPALN